MQAWQEFLALQESELGAATVQKWLRCLKVVDFDAGNLYLQASNSFQITWFDEHIRKKAHASLLTNNRRRIKIHLSLDLNVTAKSKKSKKSTPTKKSEAPSFSINFDALDPHCTFDTFISSANQSLPYKVLLESATSTSNFNPIYLCGPHGTGKTHLLMATAHTLKQRRLSVTYVRAETFTEHVVSAIRAGEMELFRHTYRKTDVLIIEDVHIFAKKWATQEELFHTFNSLHMSGKQILLSANCLPTELTSVEPRLISRFEWGIVLPLEPPQKNDLLNILNAKAHILNFTLTPRLADFLLETFKSNANALIRALEALILRLHLNPATARLTSTQISVTHAEQLLVDLIHTEQHAAINPTQIIQSVAEYFGLCAEDILGKAQTRECVLPRHIAMHLCRQQLKMPFAKIGTIFNKDHSTVMSSVKLIQKGLDNSDINIREPLQAISRKLLT